MRYLLFSNKCNGGYKQCTHQEQLYQSNNNNNNNNSGITSAVIRNVRFKILGFRFRSESI